MVPPAQDFVSCGGSRRGSTGRSHTPATICSPLQMELQDLSPAASESASYFRYDGIWWFCNLDYNLLRCKSLRLSSFSLWGSSSFSHFWCLSLTSQVLVERQRPEALLGLGLGFGFITWGSACQAFVQNKISCKKKLPVLFFVLLSAFCDDGQCSVGLGTLANDFRAVVEF